MKNDAKTPRSSGRPWMREWLHRNQYEPTKFTYDQYEDQWLFPWSFRTTERLRHSPGASMARNRLGRRSPVLRSASSSGTAPGAQAMFGDSPGTVAPHPSSTNLLGGRLEPRRIASEEHDVYALPGKFQRRCSADPCARAGDDDNQWLFLSA